MGACTRTQRDITTATINNIINRMTALTSHKLSFRCRVVTRTYTAPPPFKTHDGFDLWIATEIDRFEWTDHRYRTVIVASTKIATTTITTATSPSSTPSISPTQLAFNRNNLFANWNFAFRWRCPIQCNIQFIALPQIISITLSPQSFSFFQ